MSHEILIPALSMLIPIVTVTLSLGALIIWILVWHRRRVHEVDCRHKERMAAIEKGLDLPPEFAVRGWSGAQLGGFGWIAVAIGAAYLIFYFVEGRKAAVSERDAPLSGNDRTP